MESRTPPTDIIKLLTRDTTSLQIFFFFVGITKGKISHRTIIVRYQIQTLDQHASVYR